MALPIYWYATENDKILVNKMQYSLVKIEPKDEGNIEHKYFFLQNGVKEFFVLDLLRYKESDILDSSMYKIKIDKNAKIWHESYENQDNIDIREIKIIK